MQECFTSGHLAQDFRRLGLDSGMNVLVHSSLKSTGYVEGGPQAVISALLEVIGGKGTLLAPTITGRREFNAVNPPVFDVENTPCWTGAISETLRKHPDSIRSLHPTHSVAALGPVAEDLLYAHEVSQTPCGPETPYLRLAGTPFNGRVLFLGCTIESNTTFHGAEEVAGVPYHMQRQWTRALVISGRTSKTVTIRLHSWQGPRRNFSAALSVLDGMGALQKGRVGKAQCLLIDSEKMVRTAAEMLRDDPEWLLADDEKGKGWGSGKRKPGEQERMET